MLYKRPSPATQSASQRRARLVIHPFVLKCPECGAPSEYGAVQCHYCKVALAWGPQVPLSELDDGVGEPQYEPIRGPVLGVGPGVVDPGATMRFNVYPQQSFMPTALWIPPFIAPQFEVNSIQIGHREQLIGSSSVPASAFALGEGMVGIFQDLLLLGMLAAVTVKNAAFHPVVFSAVIRGEYIRQGTGG